MFYVNDIGTHLHLLLREAFPPEQSRACSKVSQARPGATPVQQELVIAVGIPGTAGLLSGRQLIVSSSPVRYAPHLIIIWIFVGPGLSTRAADREREGRRELLSGACMRRGSNGVVLTKER